MGKKNPLAKKRRFTAGIYKGITICVLYTTEYANIQNVIFNFVSISKNKLKYLFDVNFKEIKIIVMLLNIKRITINKLKVFS